MNRSGWSDFSVFVFIICFLFVCFLFLRLFAFPPLFNMKRNLFKQAPPYQATVDIFQPVQCVSPQNDLRMPNITYLCPSLPVEQRPSTTPRHRTMFWAALVIPDQLIHCCFSSASVSRLQLLRGRPLFLFLFPCGFQVRAWRVVLDAGFLRVCPIQPHFIRSICWMPNMTSNKSNGRVV